MSPSTRLNTALEYLAQQGCVFVRQTIVEMELGTIPEALTELTPDELEYVLTELKCIMAVYDRPDRPSKQQ